MNRSLGLRRRVPPRSMRPATYGTVNPSRCLLLSDVGPTTHLTRFFFPSEFLVFLCLFLLGLYGYYTYLILAFFFICVFVCLVSVGEVLYCIAQYNTWVGILTSPAIEVTASVCSASSCSAEAPSGASSPSVGWRRRGWSSWYVR